ncbi:male accessory gland serine protease inhibitor-like [Musca vetustissima]|uniref:male accessory gland serine protease inhibitor-like n=1 Tax=Musca vetustissima TaxID=27455 RepID=UPI002AB7BDDC|nr:male accessory gland serine protease inhibitor-like [Musca vetustissima]
MKFFAVFLAIFALISSSFALKDAICAQPHSKNGNGVMACLGYMPSWSYNVETNECVEFIYGGCMGNDNRFDTKELCEKKCKE